MESSEFEILGVIATNIQENEAERSKLLVQIEAKNISEGYSY